MPNAAHTNNLDMSVVVPFPGSRASVRPAQRSGGQVRAGGLSGRRGVSVISWVRPANCACCGRPTLAGRSGHDRVALCAHCSPPSIA
jgi:hypothetical protein